MHQSQKGFCVVLNIQPKFGTIVSKNQNSKNNISKPVLNAAGQENFAKIPLASFHAISNITFTSGHKSVPDIELKEYLALSDNDKTWLRKQCNRYDKTVNPNDLFVMEKRYLPLSRPGEMEEYVKFSSEYNKLKGSPIICLGRSPKWPLSTSFWMNDGVDGFKYIAFSKSWYDKKTDWQTGERYLVKNPLCAPSEAQETAYKAYLKLSGADPRSIVSAAQKVGKEVVITDYVQTSKGMTSFLDLVSRFAEKQGVLEDFSKSIKFFLIGSKEYSERFYREDETIPEARAVFPEALKKVLPQTLFGHPYPKQEYHDMSLNIFEQMLVNENTNECRSTFYPKEYWQVMKPCYEKPLFSLGLKDFRNLLNFRILDFLDAKNLIKRI